MGKSLVCAISFLFVLLTATLFTPFTAYAQIFVSNATFQDGKIVTYELDATGNVPPVTNIRGDATGLNSARGVAVDASWIYVVTRYDSVSVWPTDADGNVAPTRSIQGGATTLDNPGGVAVDASWIYVANKDNDSIDVWPIDADGNVAPTRSIQGGATTLNSPYDVAVDANWIYVANTTNRSVDVWPIGADGDVAPTRSIQGLPSGAVGITVDPNWIYASVSSSHRVSVWPIDADGNVAPTRSIQGGATTLRYPRGLAVDLNWIYVGNMTNGSVDVWPIGADGDVAPTRSIQGGDTALTEPWGIAVLGSTPPPGPAGDGGCFIATAAFGSPLEGHVEILRQFRDVYLMPTRVGHGFVNAYYRYSPSVADFISRHDTFRAAVRVALMPVVGMSYVALHTTAAQKIMILVLILGFVAGGHMSLRRPRKEVRL